MKYAYDKLGLLIHRGSFITYPYRTGKSIGLRIARVLDILEFPPSLSWEGPRLGVRIISAGRSELTSDEWEVSFQPLTLKDASETVVIAGINVPWRVELVLTGVSVTPFAEIEELKICL